MPYVVKHRRPPVPWQQARAQSPGHLRPFYFLNWLGEWVAYFLGKWSIFEILEYAGSFSILLAAIFYFAGAGDRVKQKHYQAWQVINTAAGKGGSGGRIEALHELNEDHVPLVGVDVSDAYLQELQLIAADLRRADFRGADLRLAVLKKSNLEGATLGKSNLRKADVTQTNLIDVRFFDADLNEAKLNGADVSGANFELADLRNCSLSQIKNWKQIKSIKLANIHGVCAAPAGFAEWALEHGAVDLADDEQWNKLIKADKEK